MVIRGRLKLKQLKQLTWCWVLRALLVKAAAGTGRAAKAVSWKLRSRAMVKKVIIYLAIFSSFFFVLSICGEGEIQSVEGSENWVEIYSGGFVRSFCKSNWTNWILTRWQVYMVGSEPIVPTDNWLYLNLKICPILFPISPQNLLP